ncbi:MAG: iron-dependent repressor IdeR [Acidimicrobiaceae bacterium]|jgi:DtxR family Mn-dependent transcriptional regulator|nr:iron-dependent repressor IdeR [Acidimicrobiaceae bacterium]|tara:strand:- start:15607 stop:16278 length:672 start_codon:yes stop_codon:yes gene_type:complete
MPYQTNDHHPAFEEYCETIFELQEDGVDVIQARIVERLQVSRPAVSEMIKKMKDADLVLFNGNAIFLSDKGKRLANQVVRRHRLAERFLTDVLGLSWAEAHHEAGKWEHVVSPRVEAAFLKLLEDPTTCPHGNPIPGSDYQVPEGTSALAEINVGNEFVIERIPEELEFQPGLLEFLEDANLIPGITGKVTAVSPDGTTTVDVRGSQVGVGAFASQRILVCTP